MTAAPMTYRELVFVRVFDAPREVVWRTRTGPDQLAAWWGPPGMRTPRETIETDVRPGGVFRVTMVGDNGAEFTSDMHHTQVEEPSLLAFAWPARRGLDAATVTVPFKDLGNSRTEVTDHFAGETNEVIAGHMKQGATEQYNKLTAHLQP